MSVTAKIHPKSCPTQTVTLKEPCMVVPANRVWAHDSASDFELQVRIDEGGIFLSTARFGRDHQNRTVSFAEMWAHLDRIIKGENP